MIKARILFKDTDGEKSSTQAWIVTGKNHLLQMRQFATDVVRFFYQPNNRSPFIIVNETELPQSIKVLLRNARSSKNS